MPEINLVDRTLHDYKNTDISIQVSLSGFSFCIHTSDDLIVRAFRYYNFGSAVSKEEIMNKVEDILHKDELLRLEHHRVRAIFTSRKSTMVPYEFFSAEQLKQLLEFNHPLEDLEEIHYNDIRFSESYLAFALPTYIAGMITEKFRNVTFYNQATPLLSYAGQLINSRTKVAVIINLNKEFFDVVVVQENALKFINTFLYVNSVDLLYFILYVCKQLKIDTKKVTFHLSGEESNRGDLIADLSDYVSNLQRVTLAEDIVLRDHMKKIDASRHFTLLHLVKCE